MTAPPRPLNPHDDLVAALASDDPARIVRALIGRTRAQIAARTARETPLDLVRRGDLDGAQRAAENDDLDRGPLWLLLLAWELEDFGRREDARVVLARLAACELWPIDANYRTYVAEYAMYLLARVFDVDTVAVRELAWRLLGRDQVNGVASWLVEAGRFDEALAVGIPGEPAPRVAWDPDLLPTPCETSLRKHVDAMRARAADRDRAVADAAGYRAELERREPFYALLARARAGDVDAAIADAERAEDPEVRTCHIIMIGELLARQGDAARARALVDRARELAPALTDDNPTSEEALLRVAEIERSIGNSTRARATVALGLTRRSLDGLRPDETSLPPAERLLEPTVAPRIRRSDLFNHEDASTACALAAAGDLADARAVLDRSDTAWERVPVLLEIALGLARAGDRDGARATLAQATKETDDGRVFEGSRGFGDVILAALELGCLDEAYTAALAARPDFPYEIRQAAEALIDAGDRDRAKNLIERLAYGPRTLPDTCALVRRAYPDRVAHIEAAVRGSI